MSTRTQPPSPSAQHTGRGAPRTTATRYRVARWVGLGVLVVLVVSIVLVVVRDSSTTDTAPQPAGGVAAPGELTPEGSIAIGDGPVTVTVYFDYLCPACGAFEEANGEALDQLLRNDDVTVELRPMAFLDRLSAGTAYSTRTANALATVVDADPGHAWAFHRALYAEQPPEGGPGLTDQQIADVARGVGVPDEVAARFAEGRYEAWVAQRTEKAFADGVEGTPTILVDGRLFEGDPYRAGSLTAAVEQAAS
jgi:protein-disulfide isomerase